MSRPAFIPRMLLVVLAAWHVGSQPLAAVAANTAKAATSGEHFCPPTTAGIGRPQDRVWLLSTRHLGCPETDSTAAPDFDMRRFDDGNWHSADWHEFLSDADRDTITVVFCDGNRVEWDEAIERGLQAYAALSAGFHGPESIRFVIWSWPSDRIRGQRRDVLVKAARTEVESYYMAQMLAQLNQNDRVSVLGFSFGGRIVSGALHLSAGGSLAGWRLPSSSAPTSRPPVRAALIAAAMHDHWLLPGDYHGAAMTRVERMLIQYNSRDRVLKWYKRMEHWRQPRALGHRGLPWSEAFGEQARRIEQSDVAWAIGTSHRTADYFATAALLAPIRRCVLWESR